MIYDVDFFTVKLVGLALGLTYTLLITIASAIFIIYVDKRLLPNIHIQNELKKGNMAVAIFASSLLLLILIVIFTGLI